MSDPARFPGAFPADARTTDQIAQDLTGIRMPTGTRLADVFPPTLDGVPIAPDQVPESPGACEVMRTLAQFESACART